MPAQNLLIALRDQKPLVHCMTNYVAMNITANVVLASGALPAMVHAPEEIDEFTPICAALTINIGTLSRPWHASMMTAATLARARHIPWVLDPAAHFISGYRKDAAQALLALRPTIIRGNASEIRALAGQADAGKGDDSDDTVDAAIGAAKALAVQFATVVAITGPTDYVTDGTREARVSGGSSLMPQVAALGCSQTALMGAYTAVGPAFDAALATLAHFKVAGFAAAKLAKGPGSFQMHFLDMLAAARPADLRKAIAS